MIILQICTKFGTYSSLIIGDASKSKAGVLRVHVMSRTFLGVAHDPVSTCSEPPKHLLDELPACSTCPGHRLIHGHPDHRDDWKKHYLPCIALQLTHLRNEEMHVRINLKFSPWRGSRGEAVKQGVHCNLVFTITCNCMRFRAATRAMTFSCLSSALSCPRIRSRSPWTESSPCSEALPACHLPLARDLGPKHTSHQPTYGHMTV